MMTVNQTILQSLEGLAENKSVFNTAGHLREAGLNVEGPDLCYVRHRVGELRELLNSAAATQNSSSSAGEQEGGENQPEQPSEGNPFDSGGGDSTELLEDQPEPPGSDAL